MNSISVGNCVSKDYTLHTRSLRNTAGRRAAQCEEMRRVEAGKKMMADMNLQDNAAARGAGVASRRCERGRVPSDSSSGISDDSSSSGSGSDRDSGIETGDTGPGLGSWPGLRAEVPVSFGIDAEDASVDREKLREALENGVRMMNLKSDKKSQGIKASKKTFLSLTYTHLFQCKRSLHARLARAGLRRRRRSRSWSLRSD